MLRDDLALLHGQKRVLEMVATSAPLPDILSELTAFIEAQEPGMRCGILVVTEDGKHFRRGCGPNLPEAYHATLDGLPITPPYRGACGEAAHRGVPIIVPDVARETRYPQAWRDLLTSHGLAALRSTPVRGPDGRVLASFAMYHDQPRDPHPANPQLIEIATHLAAIALQRGNADTFYGFVQNMPFGVYIVDADFRVAQASRSAIRAFGMGTLVGTDLAVALRTIWPDPFASEAIGRFRHTLATGEPYVAKDTVEQRADRDQVEAYDWRIERITMPDGRFGVVCYFYDLSERQRVEAELRASEARSRALATATSYALYRMSPDWSEMRQLDGRGFLSDMPAPSTDWLATYIHPDDQPHVRAAIAAAIQTRSVFDYEHRVLRYDGRLGWTHSRAVPIVGDDGAIVEWFGAASDVTARHELEKRLRESEERYRLTVESARDYAIVALDMDGTIVGWNAGAERMMGYTEAEAVGQPGAIFFTPEDRAAGAHELEMRRAREEGRAGNERWHVRRDGSRFWGSGLVMPLADGHQRGYVKIFQDKTAEHEIGVRLERAAGEFREAQRVAHIGSWVWDAATDATTGSDELYRIYGLDPETDDFPVFQEQRGRLYPAESWDRINEAVQQAIGTGAGYELDVEAFRGGERIWVTTRCEAVHDAKGRVTCLRGTVQDITERKRAEAALARAAEEFRTLADNMSQFAWMTEPDGWIFWYNRRWFDYTGTTLEQMQGWGWRDVHHPDHVERVVAKIKRAFDTGEPWEDTFPLRGADGGYRWFLSRALPIRDGNGRILRWFGTNTDITERRETEAALAARETELRSLNESLESRVREEVEAREAAQLRLAHAQRMEALGQLAGGIAHDFNNIIQAVQGGAALIRRRAGDPRTVDHLARMVEDAAERGASVTRRLLSFARRGDLHAEAVDAAALLADLHEVLAHTLAVGITVRVEAMPPALPSLLADKGQLETVLVNLATNARDAMPRGGTLTLSAAEDVIERPGQAYGAAELPPPGRYIKLALSDTGEGMTAEVLARASEPFFTTKPHGKGTGLGLAMARGFAEQSGGALAIRSTPGAGTTVTMWLPAAEEGAMAPGAAGRLAGAEPASRIGPPPRILVVDDEALVREVLAQGLEEHGYDALRASGADAALAMLDAGALVDVLLTDYAMPRMDGLALIEQARRRRPGLPAMLLTGNAGGQVEAKLSLDGVAGGVFSLLRKPVGADQLAERIRALLEKAETKP